MGKTEKIKKKSFLKIWDQFDGVFKKNFNRAFSVLLDKIFK
jgi:hypothetical protein